MGSLPGFLSRGLIAALCAAGIVVSSAVTAPLFAADDITQKAAPELLPTADPNEAPEVISYVEDALEGKARLPRILFLSSYSYIWETVPRQIAGVDEIFHNRAIVNTEFMDTKNTIYDRDYTAYYNFLAHKLSTRPDYDAVIAADDAALLFMLRYRDKLFGKIPVAFTGVDNIDIGIDAHKTDPLFFGALEQVNYEKNIEIASKFLPDATDLVFIIDRKENSIGIARQLEKAALHFHQYKTRMIRSGDYTIKELGAELSKIGKKAIVFGISMGESKDMKGLTESERFIILNRTLKTPVFRVSTSGVARGMLGGYVVDHKSGARDAAQMLELYLRAKNTELLHTFVMPSMYCFNERSLQKFDLPASQIPPGALLIDPQPTWFELYGKTFFVVLVLAVGLLLGVIGLIKTVSSRRLSSLNRQLTEEAKHARAAATAKSAFLARMSHEIRTPMNAITGMTELARRHIDEKALVQDYLGKITMSSKLLLNIINDVLDMSAIESDKISISDAVFDLKTIVVNLTTIYYVQCRNKGVRFSVDVPAPLIESMKGDALRINQVLNNLLSNAYKFTPTGGAVCLGVKQEPERNGVVMTRFTVSDTGEGMSPEMLSRLYKPFEQESSTTASDHGGSGLGMSIAYHLVSLMKGKIDVKSTKGIGTTYTVDIPLHTDPKWQVPEHSQFEGMKILLVCEEATYQSMMQRSCDAFGLRCSIVRQASDIQSEKDCDLAVMVWGGNTELATVKELRAILPDSTPILVGVYDSSSIQKEAKEAGATYFGPVPLFLSGFSQILSDVQKRLIGEETPQLDSRNGYDFGGRRVLLAEDNELNREIACELLQSVNLQVEVAVNGRQAVEKMEHSAAGYYACILMDIQMPEMNGLDATKTIRAGMHPQARIIPIFAMTANAFSSDVDLAISVGMNGHIAKPIDTSELYKTLSDALLVDAPPQV